MLFAVFCLAAAVVYLLSGLAARRTPSHARSGPNPEGIAFVGAVLLACLAGLYLSRDLSALSLYRPAGLAIVLLSGVLYILSALRGKLGLPPFISDIFVLAAAGAAIGVFRYQAFSGIRLPFSNQFANLGALAVPLTIVFVWLIARMTAALNRVEIVSVVLRSRTDNAA